MPINERDRIRFHGWLVGHDLDEEVADAILATMPPYDWHELATKADLATLGQRFDARFANVDLRLDHLDRRFDHVDNRIAGTASEVRAIMFMLLSLIVTVIVAGAATMFG